MKRRWDDDDVVVFKNCAKADGSYGEKRIAHNLLMIVYVAIFIDVL